MSVPYLPFHKFVAFLKTIENVDQECNYIDLNVFLLIKSPSTFAFYPWGELTLDQCNAVTLTNKLGDPKVNRTFKDIASLLENYVKQIPYACVLFKPAEPFSWSNETIRDMPIATSTYPLPKRNPQENATVGKSDFLHQQSILKFVKDLNADNTTKPSLPFEIATYIYRIDGRFYSRLEMEYLFPTLMNAPTRAELLSKPAHVDGLLTIYDFIGTKADYEKDYVIMVKDNILNPPKLEKSNAELRQAQQSLADVNDILIGCQEESDNSRKQLQQSIRDLEDKLQQKESTLSLVTEEFRVHREKADNLEKNLRQNIMDLEDKFQRMTTIRESLETQNRELSTDLERAQQNIKEMEDKLQQKESALISATANLKDLQDKVIHLELELRQEQEKAHLQELEQFVIVEAGKVAQCP